MWHLPWVRIGYIVLACVLIFYTAQHDSGRQVLFMLAVGE